MGGESVELWVYDLTNGMAAQLSPMLLGRRIEGVWHTSIVVGNVEHFFGQGINRAVPGSTPFGRPVKTVKLGTTEIDAAMRSELLQDLEPRFQPHHYSLLTHNCNHFSNEFAQLLVGEGIPAHIINQAEEIIKTPMGQMIMPMMLQMEGQLGNATANGFATNGPSAPAPARPAASSAPRPAPAAAPSRPSPATAAPSHPSPQATAAAFAPPPAVIILPAPPAAVNATTATAPTTSAPAATATGSSSATASARVSFGGTTVVDEQRARAAAAAEARAAASAQAHR